MFTKVLFSDDHGSVKEGIFSTLTHLSIDEVDGVQYCDDAYLRIKAAALHDTPYELLITDLSFEPDHRKQQFENGEALIKRLKQEHPSLKIIVYSMNDHLPKVRLLVKQLEVDGYVVKGREGIKELIEAIKAAASNNIYLSPKVRAALSEQVDLELTPYELQLIRLLAQGLTQKYISKKLIKEGVSPSSISSIEKKLHRLREQFDTDSNVQLITIIKDMGLL